MASPAPPSSATGGANNSMWANQSSNSRGGWGKSGEPGSAFRGMSKSRPSGRGGGRGGRGGGRPNNGGRGPPPARNEDKSKPPPEKEKPVPKVNTEAANKLAPPPPSAPISASPTQSVSSVRSSTKPKSARKPSESRGSRKAPSVESLSTPAPSSKVPPPVNASARGHRRKRSQSNNPKTPSISVTQVGPVPVSTTRKSSVSQEKAPNRVRSASAAKDLPPHLVPSQPHVDQHQFDIRHDIDALVERVRAVAMDNRPHTPGSHIDWAGDDDDSLPDLNDWGVPSNTEPEKSEQGFDAVDEEAKVISPILQDGLKTLPSIVDLEVEEPASNSTPGEKPSAVSQDKTPAAPHSQTEPPKVEAESAVEPQQPSEPPSNDAPTEKPVVPSLPLKPTRDWLDEKDDPKQSTLSASIHAPSSTESSSQNASPVRGVSASIHASVSAPSHITSHTVPSPPQSSRSTGNHPFNPSHNRSHTVGGRHRQNAEERMRRGDRDGAHARTHSTPPTGLGHRIHASRPVITSGALSALTRSLGVAPVPKRTPQPVAAAAVSTKD
ncbi:hypothetical protein K474DRAFT_1655402 [Panus rudis PR-1116 ss-1]|nr:hypothetical protein K474DRAFT_1655402 [Panus rudis PR-1116 ss-1]